MSAIESIEDQVEAEFERMRERNLSNYVGLDIRNRAHLDGHFSVPELEAIVAQLKRLNVPELSGT